MNHERRIGIDIGRVIIAGDQPGSDTSFVGGSLEEALNTPAVEGALDAIARLTTLFHGRVWLVSKCGRRTEEKTRLWLEHFRFYDLTRVPPEHVRFCRERPQKRRHAAELGLTHFIDDRLDVLEHLRGLVPHLYLFGAQSAPAPDWVHAVPTWREAEQQLRSQMNELRRDRVYEPDRRVAAEEEDSARMRGGGVDREDDRPS